MAIGFVLIKAATTYEYNVFNELSKISEIAELHSLFGEYDIIAKIKVKDLDKLGEIVINKIRAVEGVLVTKTLTGTKF